MTDIRHSRSCLAALCAGCAILLLSSSTLAGELDSARSSVRSSASESGSGSSSGGWNGCDDDDDGGIVGALVSGFLESLFTSHHDHCHDSYGDGANVSLPALPPLAFPHYPYQRGWQGYMLPPEMPEMRTKPVALRAWFDYGNDFDDLSRWRGGFLYESAGGLGLDFEWNSYTENPSVGPSDQLDIGEVNALLRIGATPYSQVRIGVGMTWLDDDVGSDFGTNFTLKVDFYPAQPVVISWDFDHGQLGETHMTHTSLTFGILWKRVEFFTGYDYRRIGAADLEGPLFGMRFWF